MLNESQMTDNIVSHYLSKSDFSMITFIDKDPPWGGVNIHELHQK